MPPRRIILEASTTTPTVGQSFTVQAKYKDGSLPDGTTRYGFRREGATDDPETEIVRYESVSRGRIRVWPLVAGPLVIDATVSRTGPDATGAITLTVAAAPVPTPEPEPEPVPDPTPVPTPTPEPPPVGDGAPEAPRVVPGTTYGTVTGTRRRVTNGAELRAALAVAKLGDEIVLANGGTYVGSQLLPRLDGTGWLVIRAETLDVPRGTRVTPAAATRNALPVLVPDHWTEPTISTAPGAHHVALVGLDIQPPPGALESRALVALGDGSDAQRTMESVPHHLIMDRCLARVGDDVDSHRAVALNCGAAAIVDSWLVAHGRGKDTQAVAGWNGPGPFLLDNVYAAGAGECVMWGGADPWIVGLTPADITLRRCHLHKPLAWRGRWMCKNLFELKHARRVLLDRVVMENNWVDGQPGFAVQLTPLTDGNTAPWTTVQDVEFRDVVIRNSAAGINVSGGNAYGSEWSVPVWPVPGARIKLHVLLEQIGTDPANGTNGRLVQVLNDVRDLHLAGLVGTGPHAALMFDGPPEKPAQRFRVTGSTFGPSYYGIFSSRGQGTAALDAYAPGWTFTDNTVVGVDGGRYPAGNDYPATMPAVDVSGFTEATRGVVVAA